MGELWLTVGVCYRILVARAFVVVDIIDMRRRPEGQHDFFQTSQTLVLHERRLPDLDILKGNLNARIGVLGVLLGVLRLLSLLYLFLRFLILAVRKIVDARQIVMLRDGKVEKFSIVVLEVLEELWILLRERRQIGRMSAQFILAVLTLRCGATGFVFSLSIVLLAPLTLRGLVCLVFLFLLFLLGLLLLLRAWPRLGDLEPALEELLDGHIVEQLRTVFLLFGLLCSRGGSLGLVFGVIASVLLPLLLVAVTEGELLFDFRLGFTLVEGVFEMVLFELAGRLLDTAHCFDAWW